MAFNAFDEHKLVTALVALLFLMAARSFPEPAGLLRHLFEGPVFRLVFQGFVAFWACNDITYALGAVTLLNVANNVLRTPKERQTAPIF